MSNRSMKGIILIINDRNEENKPDVKNGEASAFS